MLKATVAIVMVLASAAGGGDNLDYWLSRAKPAMQPAATQPTTQPVAGAAAEGVDPFGSAGPGREDALPGVVELSDGTRLAGWLYTTRDTPLSVYLDKQKRWQRVPLITVLGIRAVVVEEKLELSWRWKAMGEPERVYTGRKYPTRRFLWTFRLIDGSTVTGAVKGQPVWVEAPDGKHGPFVLHERSKGEDGQTLDELVYLRRVIVSRRLMEQVRQHPGDRPKAAEHSN